MSHRNFAFLFTITAIPFSAHLLGVYTGVVLLSAALAWVSPTAATLVWLLLFTVHWAAKRWPSRPVPTIMG